MYSSVFSSYLSLARNAVDHTPLVTRFISRARLCLKDVLSFTSCFTFRGRSVHSAFTCFSLLTINTIDLEESYTEHGRRFDDKQVPTSGRGKKKRRLKNRVYKQGELLLCHWMHKPWE